MINLIGIFQALANESRLAILRFLVQNTGQEYQSGYLAEHFNLAKSNISFHLNQLSSADLVTLRREGQFHFYAANTKQVRAFADQIQSIFQVGAVAKDTDSGAPSAGSAGQSVVETSYQLAEKTGELSEMLLHSFVDQLVGFMDRTTESAMDKNHIRSTILSQLQDMQEVLVEGSMVKKALLGGTPEQRLELVQSIEAKVRKA